MLLDLLRAAGLPHLAEALTWAALAVAAIVIALRRLVTSGIWTVSAARRT